jgi:hypothetical protein
MAKKWIQSAIKHPGALAAFEAHPPKGIGATTKRQINLAKTLQSFHRGK